MVTRAAHEDATTVDVPANGTVYELLDDTGAVVLSVIVHRPCREALVAGHLFQLEDELLDQSASAAATPPASQPFLQAL
jgi:hypothetical protein